jgi:hypothetical protein
MLLVSRMQNVAKHLDRYDGDFGPPSGCTLHIQKRDRSSADCFRRQIKKEDSIMPLIQIVVVLIVAGVVLWLINRFIPMAGSIKTILNAVVVIVIILWLLSVFGILSSFSNIRVGR